MWVVGVRVRVRRVVCAERAEAKERLAHSVTTAQERGQGKKKKKKKGQEQLGRYRDNRTGLGKGL